MKLSARPFNSIKSGNKIIEVRLYDEKRQSVELGDEIEFSKEPEVNENIKVRVIGLLRYQTFSDLTQDYPAEYFGAESRDALLDNIYNYYTKEKESQYGVLGIRIKLIN